MDKETEIQNSNTQTNIEGNSTDNQTDQHAQEEMSKATDNLQNEQSTNTKSTKKHKKILTILAITIPSIIGILLIGYIIMLISVTGSLEYFGKPFWFENGILFFGPSSCEGNNMRLRCSITADPYSECSCQESSYHDSHDQGHEYIPVDKPMIYLYPQSKLDLIVKLGHPSMLTSSYPKYLDGWNITAYPNGDLINKADNNKLYALYWEGQRSANNIDMTHGFVVKGKDSAKFLEEKLKILGLNYKEAEEFIVYWLPKLEANNYNYIYFATEEEIEQEMPLEFSVQPDTIIRIRMLFKGLNEYKEISEQPLTPAPERNGFTVIEWGGTELTD